MISSNPQISKTAKLMTFSSALDQFRLIHDEFPPQTMQLLIQVAMAPNSTMSRLASRTGLSLPQVSRHVERLGARWNGDKGHDLVTASENPDNRREKLVHLTTKGERFVQRLIEVLES